MSQEIEGNIKGLSATQTRRVERLFGRRLDTHEIVSLEFARELFSVANELGRRIGVLVSRKGEIENIFLGTREILYLPDLGRQRLGRDRLRRLRFLFSDLSNNDQPATLPQDIYTDLEKLRLDMVVGIKVLPNRTTITFAHLLPVHERDQPAVQTEQVKDLATLEYDFVAQMESLEEQLTAKTARAVNDPRPRAVLVGIYEKGAAASKMAPESIAELKELARSAGVRVLDTIIQFRQLDPRTLIGKGKLEELVLQCLRLDAEMVIFDCELKPTQWRSIVNSTDLKVLDRSMLILDIFAQRASSADGRVQVELAQLKYLLPRLTELDSGLSRLSGGIGGRGPGETKLEIGRRRARDRIADLESRIEKLGEQRRLRRTRRTEFGLPVVALVGYTNVGKSTLFNQLTNSSVVVENKLFATLDPARRKLSLAVDYGVDEHGGPAISHQPIILADTVGFIRDLPEELRQAFRATLEEVGEAKLILHVLDASDPNLLQHKAAVDGILEQMSLTDIPKIIVLNKSDLVPADEVDGLARSLDGVSISAVKRSGFSALTQQISQLVFAVQAGHLVNQDVR